MYACAAKEKDACLVIANVNPEVVCVDMNLRGVNRITECKIIKDGTVWENYEFKNQLPGESVIIIKFDL